MKDVSSVLDEFITVVRARLRRLAEKKTKQFYQRFIETTTTTTVDSMTKCFRGTYKLLGQIPSKYEFDKETMGTKVKGHHDGSGDTIKELPAKLWAI